MKQDKVLAARRRQYDEWVSGKSTAGRKANAVASGAFHKPGSNKK